MVYIIFRKVSIIIFFQSTNELEESRMALQRERNELPWE